VPVCGVLGGVSGALFSRTLIAVARGLPRLPKRVRDFVSGHRVAFGALCGLGVALCGLVPIYTQGVHGTGYIAARTALAGNSISVYFAPLKFAATTLSSISGIPGGIFSPSIAVGAGLGSDIALLFPHTMAGAVILLGMVSYFTGVVQAPITAFVIVSEMTN